MRIIERVEGVELVGILLGGTIPTKHLPTEINANLGDERPSFVVGERSQFDTGDQIFLAISSQLADGKLAARKDHRFC